MTDSRRCSTGSREKREKNSISSHISSLPTPAQPTRTCWSWHYGSNATAFVRTRFRPFFRRPWLRLQLCTILGRIPSVRSRAPARPSRFPKDSRHAACTRRFFDTMIRTTGRCCARRCDAWVGQNSSVAANSSWCRLINRGHPVPAKYRRAARVGRGTNPDLEWGVQPIEVRPGPVRREPAAPTYASTPSTRDRYVEPRQAQRQQLRPASILVVLSVAASADADSDYLAAMMFRNAAPA